MGGLPYFRFTSADAELSFPGRADVEISPGSSIPVGTATATEEAVFSEKELHVMVPF